MHFGLWLAIAILYTGSDNPDSNRYAVAGRYALYEMEEATRTTGSLIVGTDSNLNAWLLQVKKVNRGSCDVFPVNVKLDEPLVLLSRGEFVQDFMQKSAIDASDIEYIKDELGKNKAKPEDIQKVEKYTLDGSIVYYLYASSESNAELLVDHPYWMLVRGKKCLALEYSKLIHCVEIDGTRYYVLSRLEWVDKVLVDIYDAEFNRVDFVQLQDSE